MALPRTNLHMNFSGNFVGAWTPPPRCQCAVALSPPHALEMQSRGRSDHMLHVSMHSRDAIFGRLVLLSSLFAPGRGMGHHAGARAALE